MFFWIGLPVVLVIAFLVMAWGARGIEGRAHEPRSQRLRPRG